MNFSVLLGLVHVSRLIISIDDCAMRQCWEEYMYQIALLRKWKIPKEHTVFHVVFIPLTLDYGGITQRN